MPEQVEVSYRGILVGRGELHEGGPSTAFVAVEQPMPVGTRVEVRAGEVAFAARVLRVDEKGEGVEVAGMRIEAVELSEAAQAWWRERIIADEPPAAEVAPEPASEAASAGAADAVSDDDPSDAARTAMMDAVELEQIESRGAGQSDEEFTARQREAEAAMREPKPAGAEVSASSDRGDAGSAENRPNGRRSRRRRKRRR